MRNQNHWMDRFAQRLGRRRLLRAGVWSTAGAAGAFALGAQACGQTKKASPAATSGSNGIQAANETPRPGGTLSVYTRASYPLDPHKTPNMGTQVLGGAMSRLFRF